MAQRRMIAKSISTSKKVNKLSDKAALLYTWLIPHCDDFGHMDADPEAVKAIVVPMRRWSLSDVKKCLMELQIDGLIEFYYADGEDFLEIIQFGEFQTFKNDRDRIALYPEKTASNIGNPLDSTGFHSDSYKLSQVKLSKDKLSEDTSPTPVLQASKFFEMCRLPESTEFSQFLGDLHLSTKIPIEVLEREIRKFVSYWTEKNKSGTKQRWELERTFEVQRRLAKWFSNAQKWSGQTKNKGKQIV